ncbi:uncharacterized protein EI97DRAFT_194196 [Westerdykella ornata]|uniref:EKC/KEOPS complex subunit GON7 n=1 Tax=Westerdykella ornata TaxID=318751 RepID=A0A6A6J8L1_WESOR|nr:uncharacterized protein EI97DRAFT_194196 [Westerdykella ornata]KAF2272901.1 hypothetical protein EI97DRAFT_194196 [Westerdykella ornata]
MWLMPTRHNEACQEFSPLPLQGFLPSTKNDKPNIASMPALKAEYTSPTCQSYDHAVELPAISSSPSTDERVDYLRAMQSGIKTLQENLNKFLTEKMAEEKASGEKKEDVEAEENYGEEVVDGE